MSTNDYAQKRENDEDMIQRDIDALWPGCSLQFNQRLLTVIDNEVNRNATENLIYYYHPDHLGSSNTLTDITGLPFQHMEYMPFGETFVEENTGSYSTPYRFTSKELDDETGLYYYGARYYDPQKSFFYGVDPLSNQNPNESPFVYCRNNPVMLVDPDGRKADWVKNNYTNKYEWMDNVTDPGNTPSGYSYIGPSDNDILNDLNLPQSLPSINVITNGYGLDGEGKGVAPTGSTTSANGKLLISPVVSYSYPKNNNLLGRKFEGVNFTALFAYKSFGSNSDLNLSYQGYLSVKYGSKLFTSQLKSQSGFNFSQPGSTLLQASLFISAGDLGNNKSFDKACISAGACNNLLITSPKPIKINWNLQLRDKFSKAEN